VNEEHTERYLKKMYAIINGPPGNHQERVDALFVRIKARLSDLEAMAEKLEAVEENGVYRFYHGSFKVFNMQEPIKEAFKLIEEIGGVDDPPHLEYALLVKAGTENDFAGDRTNANWDAETKPILEAFWHTKYFIKMMVKYGKKLEKVEPPLDYGMAAVLYLFELR
jgi:hypothetical protein